MSTSTKGKGKDDIINKIFDGPENFRKLLKKNTDISKLLGGYGPKKTSDLIKYFHKYYPQNDIITEIKSEYPDIEINEKHNEKLQMKSEEIREIIDFINSINCGPTYKERIISKIINLMCSDKGGKGVLYGSIYEITEDPLILKDFITINLKKIDEIAIKNHWWDTDGFYRYYSFCKSFVQKYCEEKGSVYFKKNDLDKFIKGEIRCSDSDINVDFYKISTSIESLENEEYIFKSKRETYYYRDYYNKEKEILQILDASNTTIYENDELDKGDLEDEDLTKEQLLAINGIRKHRVSTLNGAGGTGKTDKVIKKICEYVNKNSSGYGKKIIFAAPTHAAKKNGVDKIKMENIIEYTVVAALTIHSASKLKTILQQNNIEYLFIDESSMASMLDYHIILKTVDEYLEENPDSELHITFIGDENQLEPIGIGTPYKELLDKIPLFKLTKNYRAKKSPHLIEFLNLILNKTEKYNKWILDEKTQKEYCDNVEFLFTKNKEDYYSILEEKLINLKEEGIKPYNGVSENCFQIISPWGDSRDYQYEITRLIRIVFKGDESEELYKKGDYVTLSKNVKGLFFNNDMGKIVKKDEDGYTIKLNTQIEESFIKKYEDKKGEPFNIESEGWKIKVLSKTNIIIPHTGNKDDTRRENKFLKSNYCRTVHSLQGLQFSHVLYVVPDNTSFLNMNMNYTAYSRAKDKLYLIGNRYSFEGGNAKKGKESINTILKFKGSLIKDIEEILSNEENTLISQNMNIEKCLNIRKDKKFATWKRDFGAKPEGECSDCKKVISINNYNVFLKDKNGNHELDNMKCVCRLCFNKNR